MPKKKTKSKQSNPKKPKLKKKYKECVPVHEFYSGECDCFSPVNTSV